MQGFGHHDPQRIILEPEVAPKMKTCMNKDKDDKRVKGDFVHFFGKLMQSFGTNSGVDLQNAKGLDHKGRKQSGQSACQHHNGCAILQKFVVQRMQFLAPSRQLGSGPPGQPFA